MSIKVSIRGRRAAACVVMPPECTSAGVHTVGWGRRLAKVAHDERASTQRSPLDPRARPSRCCTQRAPARAATRRAGVCRGLLRAWVQPRAGMCWPCLPAPSARAAIAPRAVRHTRATRTRPRRRSGWARPRPLSTGCCHMGTCVCPLGWRAAERALGGGRDARTPARLASQLRWARGCGRSDRRPCQSGAGRAASWARSEVLGKERAAELPT